MLIDDCRDLGVGKAIGADFFEEGLDVGPQEDRTVPHPPIPGCDYLDRKTSYPPTNFATYASLKLCRSGGSHSTTSKMDLRYRNVSGTMTKRRKYKLF